MILTPGVCIIKLCIVVIYSVVQYASVFAIFNHFLQALTNILPFYIMELIMTIIGFMIQAHGVNIIKHFWCKFTHSFLKSITFHNTENDSIINTMAEPTIRMNKFTPKRVS